MKMNVLVIAEGAPNFWEQIAVGFHAAGCAVSFAVHGPDMIRDLLAAGRRFDLAVANQATMNALAVAARDNRGFPWRNHLGGLVMVQFHDVFREIPTLDQASQIFSWVGLPLTYWVYCARSADVLKRFPLYEAFFQQDLPVCLDAALAAPTPRPAFISDIAPFVVAAPSFAPSPSPSAGGPLAVYLGSCPHDSKTTISGPLSGGDLLAAMREHVAAGRAFDRAGFAEFLIERGMATLDDVRRCFVGEYVCAYGARVVQAARLMFVRALKQRFGDRFALYGDDWRRQGVAAEPADFSPPQDKYRAATACLDFGSQFIDASLYQRTMEIAAAGGRLLQLRQSDGGGPFAPYLDLVGFSDVEELASKLEELERPAARAAFCARQTEMAAHMRERLNPAAACRNAAARAMEREGER